SQFQPRASFVRTNVVSGTSPASLAEFADGSVPPSPAEAAGPERPTSVAVSAPPRDDVMSCPSCGVVSSQLTDAPHFVGDRKSTRLNSSHVSISYAVFCLKKKKLLTSCDIHRTFT